MYGKFQRKDPNDLRRLLGWAAEESRMRGSLEYGHRLDRVFFAVEAVDVGHGGGMERWRSP
jgi:hypothetical protein